MSSHEEAQDMVTYYEQHPAALYGKPITFYLSKRLMVIEVMLCLEMKTGNKTFNCDSNCPRTPPLKR